LNKFQECWQNVKRLNSEGLNDWEIAEKYNISHTAVSYYRKKLGIPASSHRRPRRYAIRNTVLMDGDMEVPKEEMQAFIKKAGMTAYNFIVIIPMSIARKISLEKGDWLMVAIKKCTEKEREDFMREN